MLKKEALKDLVSNMEKWQKIERIGVRQTAEIQEQTEQPLIQLVMEIIQRDSTLHHRVQQMIIDSLTTEAYTFTPDDLVDVWTAIEKHITLERKTIELANASLAILSKGQGRSYVLQQYLLAYLLADEKKHDMLLDELATIKKGMYPGN